MIQTIKQNKKAVLAFLLALVMVIGLIPFTATEAHAMTIEANGDVTWEKDDSLTLYLVNKDDPTKTETHTVTYDGTNWSTFKSEILPAYAFAHIGEVKDIAYKDGKWNYTPVLKSGYNVLSDLADADVMVATSEVVAGTDLSLKFEHCFSKVSFHCWPNTEFEGNTDITGIRVSDSNVIAYHEADAFEAIIAPRSYAEGEFFATVTVNSGNGVSMELTVKVPEGGLTFEAGKHYTFNLTVGKDTAK